MKERKLRQYEHLLAISGVGVIAFGLWSIVKAALYFILFPVDQLKEKYVLEDLESMYEEGFSDREVVLFVAAVVLLAMTVDFLLRLYIGRAAIADGRGTKKKRFAYVIWAMFVASGLISNMVSRWVLIGKGEESLWTNLTDATSVSMIIDLTSLFAVTELIVAAFMVRKLRRELGIVRTEGA